MANIPVKIEFGAVDKITPILGSIRLNLKGIGKSIEVLESQTKKISFLSSFSAMAQGMSVLKNYSSQLTQNMMGNIDSFSNVEDNINRIKILLDKNSSPNFISSLKNQFRELSEITTHTQSEISDLAKNVVNTGIVNPEQIKQLTRLSLQLSDASKNDLSSHEAMDIITEFKNTFRLDKRLNDIPDLIAYGKDKGKESYHDILESYKYSAPILASATNATPEQFMAMQSVLAAHGLKGSTLGTSLRKITLSLIPRNDTATIEKLKQEHVEGLGTVLTKGHDKALRDVGLTLDKITDKNGKIDFNQSLFLLKQNLEKKYSTDAQRLSVLKNIFGTEAIPATITFKEFFGDYLKTLKDISENYKGKSIELSESTRNTLASKIKETENAWDNFKVSILDSQTGDYLKSLTDSFKKIGQWINHSPNGVKTGIGVVGIGAYGITQAADKLSPVLMSGYFLKELGFFKGMKNSLGLLVSVFPKIFKMFAVLASALSFGCGIGAIILGITSVVALGYSLYQLFQEYPLSGMIHKLKSIIGFDDSGISKVDKNNVQVKTISHSKLYEDIWNQNQCQKSFEIQTSRNFGRNQESIDSKNYLHIKFDNLPRQAKVIQKSQFPMNLDLGYAGAFHD